MEVVKPGLLSTVQDGGRIGQARFGVAPSGAMDVPALRLANALVGNGADAAALELTLLGPVLRFQHEAVIAITGAEIDVRVDAAAMPMWRPLYLPAGTLLTLGGMRRGARSYIAFAGGLQVSTCLGSASADVNAGIGRALRSGDELETLAQAYPAWRGDRARVHGPSWSLAPAHWFDLHSRPLRAVTGRHFDALDDTSRSRLFADEFRVASDSNRVGFRLQGTPLQLVQPLELISEAVDFGTVQLPPGGAPIVLMAEHPTTGGYPRIAQIAAVDLPYLAQHRPGDRLRFERIDAGHAERLLIEQERALDEMIAEIGRRLL
jgi:antagonist of KipI